jgi:hypothetical protein
MVGCVVAVCYAHTYSKSEDEKGFVSGEGELGTPESLPEPERPPLRHIDRYIRPECPCLSKRYTLALLTCVGTVLHHKEPEDVAIFCFMVRAVLSHQIRRKDNLRFGRNKWWRRPWPISRF